MFSVLPAAVASRCLAEVHSVVDWQRPTSDPVVLRMDAWEQDAWEQDAWEQAASFRKPRMEQDALHSEDKDREESGPVE